MSAVVYSGTFTPFGLIIPFHIGPSATRKTELQERGIPIPEPQAIKAMIDTGASHTVICRGLLRDEIYGPALGYGGGLDFLGRSYDVAYRRVQCHFAELETELVVGEWPLHDDRHTAYQCCIGRDLLALSDFIVDGEALQPGQPMTAASKRLSRQRRNVIVLRPDGNSILSLWNAIKENALALSTCYGEQLPVGRKG